MTDWQDIQHWAGVTADGIPGPATARAIKAKAGIGDTIVVEAPVEAHTDLTARAVLEIAEHEGVVLEAYKDSVGVWTWGVGVTSNSGHSVSRYRDNPSTMTNAMAVYIWLLREKYLPAVLWAFKDRPLAEHELAAALSFHWNTGAIGRADWVKKVLAGDTEGARASFMNWRSPAEIIPRRRAERDLFFDGKWTSDGIVPVYGVAKPSYSPRGATLVDIRPALAEALR